VVGTSNWTLDDEDHQVILRHIAKRDSFPEPPFTRREVTGGGVYAALPTLAEASLDESAPEANPNDDE
jgi:hypothetical protein